MCDIGLHDELADLLYEIIMVRDGFLSLPTWLSRDLTGIDDVIYSFIHHNTGREHKYK